ncbi:hypothetical protein SISNIDRAFT_453883 [Sistotremastrum niveocremeum HHB9708]|uniref:Fungal-type protein kinase domain-containing protein n=1 Tax=Sistotremastrum niveocremeum HHB9708 TaxID=1314777 RepID=A0A164VHF8_9AGAM|nr:hypothetical protein SISNIDRAFT_453883 [Sistotremastrum niveocremeum HHB9708]
MRGKVSAFLDKSSELENRVLFTHLAIVHHDITLILDTIPRKSHSARGPGSATGSGKRRNHKALIEDDHFTRYNDRHASWQSSHRIGTIAFTSTRIGGALSYFPDRQIFHFSVDDLESANWVLLWAVLARIPVKQLAGTLQESWKQKLSESDPKENLDGKKVMLGDILQWQPPLASISSACHPSDAMLPFAALFNQLFTITARATREFTSLLKREAAPSPSQMMEMSQRHYKEWAEIMLDANVVSSESC